MCVLAVPNNQGCYKGLEEKESASIIGLFKSGLSSNQTGTSLPWPTTGYILRHKGPLYANKVKARV